MKKLILLLFFGAMLFFTNEITAQAGSGGSHPDVETIQKCHETAGGVQTGFYAVYVYRVGKTDEQTLIGTFESDGTTYVVPGTGTVTLGACSQAATGGALDSFDFTFHGELMCDAGTNNFIRLFREKCNNISNECLTTVVDKTFAGVSYTVIGTVTAGACNQVQYRNMAPDVYNITNTQAFNNDYYSISVSNIGTKTFTITTNAATFDLLPGGEYKCSGFFNEFTGKVEYCPSYTITGISINATVINVTRHSN